MVLSASKADETCRTRWKTMTAAMTSRLRIVVLPKTMAPISFTPTFFHMLSTAATSSSAQCRGRGSSGGALTKNSRITARIGQVPAKKSRSVACRPLLGPGMLPADAVAAEIEEGDDQAHGDVQEGKRQLEQDDAAHGNARHGLEKEQPGIERPDQLPVVAEPEVQEGVEGRLQLHPVGGDLDQRRREQRPARHGQEADDGRRDHGHQALVADHGVQRIDQPVVHAPALLHGADVLHQDDDQEELQRLAVASPPPRRCARRRAG